MTSKTKKKHTVNNVRNDFERDKSQEAVGKTLNLFLKKIDFFLDHSYVLNQNSFLEDPASLSD